ncbi:hypothetical protein AVEN_256112-1 [Araneus ventricosus]|uniref:Uncharacterized protein n=1 Tax=Araneus ventricosus TaxID=182803 RepID=A0A4Y2D5M6_ARAVE|nr:hypothetical protein AVEN_256112-1 [Araneus ventricosus]
MNDRPPRRHSQALWLLHNSPHYEHLMQLPPVLPGSAVYGALSHTKSYVLAKRLPTGGVRKLGEGVPDQVLSLPSDRDSNLRVPSLNSPRVPSKLDANLF